MCTSPQNVQCLLNDLVGSIITTSGKLLLRNFQKLTIVKKQEEIITLINEAAYQIPQQSLSQQESRDILMSDILTLDIP